jgi:predicted O-methyltransferase YrrM
MPATIREVPLDASLNPQIPEIGIDELCPAEVAIKILHPEFQSGGVYPIELICLDQIAASFLPERVFEIGTFNGRTTLNLAANTPASAKLFTLDLPEASSGATVLRAHDRDPKYMALRRVGKLFRESGYREKITQLYGDSATFDYSPWAGTIDLVLVDGAHSCDYVMSDSVKTLPLLRPETGIMLWHDYGTWDEVTAALDALYRKSPAFAGVRHIRGTSLVIRRQ